MKAETFQTIETIKQSLDLLGRFLDIDSARARLNELSAITADPALWNNRESAQKLLKEQDHLKFTLARFDAIARDLNDNVSLIEMGEAENDASVVADAEKGLKKTAKDAKQLETEGLFSGEADANNCFMEINAGAGGTESCDWAAMLMRMYLRWAEWHGFSAEMVDEHAGEGAGIKSATIKVSGMHAYGWAKTESGVHRLVRISPFDSNKRRHTSFASVWVYPEIDDSIEVAIEEKDLRVDTFRASGAGGQHVNKTDSAIRITHIPTNIVVQCQTGRSQHRNRADAYKMLKARLYELELRKREEAANAMNAQKTDNSWGNQIRSYVLHPYQMVKDLRTGVETSDTGGVLDGDLDAFMSAALAERVINRRKDA
ncbi:MAG: peptide chain release factor 2 [Proteobacteria bacterium]|nr:peptide chain release factor 2 [Pseudomonadota bacterium]